MTTPKKVPKVIREMTAKAGRAGRGESKRRPREHYVAIGKLRWERERERKAQEGSANA